MQHFNKKKPFKAAFDGLKIAYSTQKHVRLHLFSTGWVLVSGWFLHVSVIEWCILLLCIAMVIGAELINTALEQLADYVKPDYHPIIGKAKDIAAASVLCISLFATVIGLIIFLPKIINLIS
tara:strand:- start:132 stop:497 length:366 start_codon:yes stop_codon:yes gene_type:complete